MTPKKRQKKRQQPTSGRDGGAPARSTVTQHAAPTPPEEETIRSPPTVTPPVPPLNPPLQRVFVEVGASRIQTWVERTPKLRYRRGASVLLELQTSQATIKKLLPAGVTWNDEAGEVSGIVSVSFGAGEDTTANDRLARITATTICRHLREQMPALELLVHQVEGESYDAILARRAVQADEPSWEIPVVQDVASCGYPCQQCLQSPAQRDWELKGEVWQLCTDCHKRIDALTGGFVKEEVVERQPKAQQRLDAAVRSADKERWTALKSPRADFSELAALVKHARETPYDAATQVALIQADGNAVGDFNKSLAADAGRYVRKSERARAVEGVKPLMARALQTATEQCVADATCAVLRTHDPKGRLPTIPVLAHYVAGDDLMVSVPAPFAWTFVQELCGSYSQAVEKAARVEAARRGITLSEDIPWPTLSAGLVFSHAHEPFPDVARHAEAHLTRAKNVAQRREPSVSFLDMTADGQHTPKDRAVKLTWLIDHQVQLAETAAVSPSQRTQLLTLLREASAGSAAGVPHGAQETLVRRLDVMGLTALKDWKNDLRRALDLARWWPVTVLTGVEDA